MKKKILMVLFFTLFSRLFADDYFSISDHIFSSSGRTELYYTIYYNHKTFTDTDAQLKLKDKSSKLSVDLPFGTTLRLITDFYLADKKGTRYRVWFSGVYIDSFYDYNTTVLYGNDNTKEMEEIYDFTSKDYDVCYAKYKEMVEKYQKKLN